MYSKFLAYIVYFFDISAAFFHALISFFALLFGFALFSRFTASFGKLDLKIAGLADLDYLIDWTMLQLTGPDPLLMLMTWLYGVTALFAFTLAALAGHEAIVRFRIRHG